MVVFVSSFVSCRGAWGRLLCCLFVVSSRRGVARHCYLSYPVSARCVVCGIGRAVVVVAWVGRDFCDGVVVLLRLVGAWRGVVSGDVSIAWVCGGQLGCLVLVARPGCIPCRLGVAAGGEGVRLVSAGRCGVHSPRRGSCD